MARSDVSARVPNQDLADWLAEHSLTEAEFADRINLQTAALTGHPGNTTDRTVRRWLSGEVRWPQAKQREALTRLTGRGPEDLGFTPRSTVPPPRSALSQGQHRRVGVSDVRRLAASLTGIVAADDRFGGTTAVEERAAHLAREVLALQQHGSASGRVRNMLYSLAAASMCSALWAATEGHRLDAAHRYLHESVTLAGLSADPAVQFRVWGSAAVLYRRCGRGTDALAAIDVTRSLPIVRRDPVYASLAHAHTAAQYATIGDRAAVQRGIDRAQSALDRAEPTRPRPSWMLFHDQAQLDFFALIAESHLGQWAQAEAHAHRSLALLRPGLVRNRHRTLLFLARVQLEQGDLEAAVASVHAVPREEWHGRTGRLVTALHTRVTAIDPRMWPTGR